MEKTMTTTITESQMTVSLSKTDRCLEHAQSVTSLACRVQYAKEMTLPSASLVSGTALRQCVLLVRCHFSSRWITGIEGVWEQGRGDMGQSLKGLVCAVSATQLPNGRFIARSDQTTAFRFAACCRTGDALYDGLTASSYLFPTVQVLRGHSMEYISDSCALSSAEHLTAQWRSPYTRRRWGRHRQTEATVAAGFLQRRFGIRTERLGSGISISSSGGSSSRSSRCWMLSGAWRRLQSVTNVARKTLTNATDARNIARRLQSTVSRCFRRVLDVAVGPESGKVKDTQSMGILCSTC